MYFHNLIVLLFFYSFCLLFAKSDRKTKVFIGDQNLSHLSKFNHLVIDKSRQQIFIGAINGIYQLSLDLELKNSYIDEVCLPSSLNAKSLECTKQNESLAYNSNKILLIHKNELIFCGGVYGGECQVHNVLNISKVMNSILQPTVPNDPNASTVALISPRPWNDSNGWQVLYVAATYSNNSESVPAIARRSLNENGNLTIFGQKNENFDRISLDEKYRNKYIINYIYGFSFENFNYFVTTQKNSTSQNSPYISKIVGMCAEDDNLYSVYMELPLECVGADGQSYNLAQSAFVGQISNQLDKSSQGNNKMDALFVTFARSKLPTNDTFTAHGDKSALCVFSLEMINQKFTQNSAECQGKTKTECNVAFIKQNKGTNLTNCAIVYPHGPIGGITSISATPMLTFNILLTAVTAKMIEKNTLIVVGTSNGHLKKIIAETATDAREYGDIPIDEGSPVNSDLLFDATGDYLYALTERKLTKIKILDCSHLKTCECKDGKNPLCGWCTSSNSCELKLKCPDRESIPPPAKCIPVTSVTPEELLWGTNENLRLTFEGKLPQNIELLCTFDINGTVSSTEAKRDNHDPSVLECVMSDRSKFASLISHHHHTTADLSVKTRENSVFAETNVKFFNCNEYTSCASCVFSSYPCKWCSENRICTLNVSADCMKSNFVDNLKTLGRHNENDHHQYCPTINIIANKSGINVPEGTKRNVTIKINDIEPFELDPNYECEFSWNSNVSHRKAILLDKKIICDEMEFTYAKNITNITTSLAVVWSNSKVFKNTEKVAITIYKCSHMGNACKTCMSLNETYGCGWCKTTRTCEIKSKCYDWRNKNYICPLPSISTFWPQSGPYEGGTNITIFGENLDSLDGARDNLKIAGIPCQFHEKLYNFGKEIVCKIANTNLNKTFTGKVALMMNNSSYQSEQNYSFVDPKIESFSPKRGPISGGTVLVFKGQHMNAGSLIEIFIGNLPCKVVSNNSNEIECITNSSNEAFEGVVVLKFDENNRTFKGNSFQYIDTKNFSPIILFTPETGPYEGGTNITIMCTYLDQNFEDLVHSIQVAGVNCRPNNYTYIPGKQVSCRVDLISDGISSLDHHMGPVVLKIDNMTMKSPTNFIFVNPKVHRFRPKRGPISGGTVIFFEGEYMNAGYLTEIFIDSLPCEVIDKHSIQIMCRTKPSRRAFRGVVTVKFDGNERTFENNIYEYTDNESNFKWDIGFDPIIGPYEGGTNITIQLKTLLQKLKGTCYNITVAGVLCRPYAHECKIDQEIACKVDGIGQTESLTGPVIFNTENSSFVSRENYSFVDPKIESFFPNHGPTYGAAELTLKGQHMNAGKSIKIFIDEIPCNVFAKNSNEIKCFTNPSNKSFNGSIIMQFDGHNRTFINNVYEYTNSVHSEQDAQILTVPRGIPSGGILLLIQGNNLSLANGPQFCVLNDDRTTRYCTECKLINNSLMNCSSPVIPDINDTQTSMQNPKQFDYGIKVTNEHVVKSLYINKTCGNFSLYPDYTSKLFPNWQKVNLNYSTLEILQKNKTPLGREYFIDHHMNQFTSSGVIYASKYEYSYYTVTDVKDWKKKTSPMKPETRENSNPWSIKTAIYSVLLIIPLLVAFLLILFGYRKKMQIKNFYVTKKMRDKIEELELHVAAECKEAFAELQTEMPDFKSDISLDNIPFLDYRKYVENILFPSTGSDPIVPEETSGNSCEKEKLNLFSDLIMKKTFLLLFIRTLEANENFSMSDRIKVASMIMIALQNKMEYCTDILKILLAELIEKYVDGKRHPKLLLRRTESVVEKMLSSWFTLLLYGFLKERAGESLYMLFRAIKQHVYKGPVDMITSEAKYSLSQEKLIRQCVNYKTLTVYVTRPLHVNADFVEGLPSIIRNIPVKVLDCDTISQVKEKALDIMYRTMGFSQRPKHSEFDIQWVTDTFTRKTLYDDDVDSEIEAGWRKKNTLRHYGVPDGSIFNLVSLEHGSIFTSSTISIDRIGSLSSPASTESPTLKNFQFLLFPRDRTDRLNSYESNKFVVSKNTRLLIGQSDRQRLISNTSERSVSKSSIKQFHWSPLTSCSDNEVIYKEWHLVQNHDHGDDNTENDVKLISEIYLTRLLATKGTLQKFVDDLFQTIFSTNYAEDTFPLVIKYMFDFLDDQALQHGILDPEVVHAWRNNSLPLRFWVNLIKNPNFLFDIDKSNIVDACLSVVAQAFMDSCSTSDCHLTKDSPSAKLLYAKDIPGYKKLVHNYYSYINTMPSVSDQDMNTMFSEYSDSHAFEFDTNRPYALLELLKYAIEFEEQLMSALRFSHEYDLVNEFKEVLVRK